MRRIILGTIGLLLLSIPGWAQESSYPKAEVFGGFSISSMGVSSTDPTTGLTTSLRDSFWGWQASADLNVHRHLGFVGDFGGQYKTVLGIGMSNYQYMFGPQISMRMDKVNPFVHVLFGAARTSASLTNPITGLAASVSSTGLGMGIGGGLDVNISNKLALRVPQFDWTPIHAGGVWNNNTIRIGIGLVFKAGEK
jgi:opacity protein-like surface antigen